MEFEMGDRFMVEKKSKEKRKKAIKKNAVKFTKIVSLVGIRHATDSRNSSPRRFIWMLWLAFGIAFAIYQTQERIIHYFKYPSNTEISIEKGDSLRFPQITFCSDNQIMATKARNKGVFGSIAQVENTMQRIRVYTERPSNYSERRIAIAKEQLTKYLAEVHNRTTNWENMSKELAPTRNQAIKLIKFNNVKPNNTLDLIEEIPTDIGHCFAVGTTRKPLITNQTGSRYGLSLMLTSPRYEIIPSVRYLSSVANFPGFKILIHDPLEIPLLKYAGFTVKPGTTTRVTIEFENITLQGHPYGSCNESDWNYRSSNCRAYCDYRSFIKKCGCRDIHMPENSTESNSSVCTYGTILKCSNNLDNETTNRTEQNPEQNCTCPQECHRRVYKEKVTSTALSVISEELKKELDNVQTDELIQLDIYFQQLSYLDSRSEPAYTPFKLLCDVGNALSLLLGATLLTIYEASEFIALSFKDYVRFRLTK